MRIKLWTLLQRWATRRYCRALDRLWQIEAEEDARRGEGKTLFYTEEQKMAVLRALAESEDEQ